MLNDSQPEGTLVTRCSCLVLTHGAVLYIDDFYSLMNFPCLFSEISGTETLLPTKY
jgi:hypothetical protein